MIDAGIAAVLLAAGSGDAIDTYASGQVFAGAAPDDLSQYPCLSYAFVGGASDPTLATSGVQRQRVEINAFAAQPDVVNGLSAGSVAALLRGAVIQRLNGWQAMLSDGTNVLDAVLLDPGTDFVSEDRIFRCMCEFYILFTYPTS